MAFSDVSVYTPKYSLLFQLCFALHQLVANFGGQVAFTAFVGTISV